MCEIRKGEADQLLRMFPGSGEPLRARDLPRLLGWSNDRVVRACEALVSTGRLTRHYAKLWRTHWVQRAIYLAVPECGTIGRNKLLQRLPFPQTILNRALEMLLREGHLDCARRGSGFSLRRADVPFVMDPPGSERGDRQRLRLALSRGDVNIERICARFGWTREEFWRRRAELANEEALVRNAQLNSPRRPTSIRNCETRMPANTRRALEAFLCAAFSTHELRREISFLPGTEALTEHLPGGSVSHAEFVHSAVGMLERRGLIYPMLRALKVARPRAHATIDAIRRQSAPPYGESLEDVPITA